MTSIKKASTPGCNDNDNDVARAREHEAREQEAWIRFAVAYTRSHTRAQVSAFDAAAFADEMLAKLRDRFILP